MEKWGRLLKRAKNLFEKIVTEENFREANRKTSLGKRYSFGYLEWKEYSEVNLSCIREEVADGGYKIGRYREFWITDPKPRLISALDYKDRLVQHALCNVITPIFEASFLPQSFACRDGLGTHAGIKYIQATLRKTKAEYFLKTDFRKYFPSIDHPILHKMIDRKVGCPKTLDLIREIIPVEGKGIPIGSLTSQLFANVYGNALDRFVHLELKMTKWARYMDDLIVMDTDKNRLFATFQAIKQFSEDKLAMTIGKWQVSPISRGVNFLGFRVWPSHKLIRKDSVIRAKRKIAKFMRHNDNLSLEKFLASWRGHACWADTHNLFTWMEKRHGIVCN